MEEEQVFVVAAAEVVDVDKLFKSSPQLSISFLEEQLVSVEFTTKARFLKIGIGLVRNFSFNFSL